MTLDVCFCIVVVYIFSTATKDSRDSTEDVGFNMTFNHFRLILTALLLQTGFDQGCRGWKLEHTVIVLKSMFDASPALATVTHPQLFHCVVPRCFSACVSIHHVCACCTKVDPLQNRLQSVIHTELSLTTG